MVGCGLLPIPPGPLDPLKAGVQPRWPARQAGIMGMTQPKRRLTSSTQHCGRRSGGAWHSGSVAPPSEPAGQPGCRLSRLPKALSEGCWAWGLHLSRTHFLPAQRSPCPRRSRSSAWVPPAQVPSGPGLGPGPGPGWGRGWGLAGQGWEPDAGKGYSRPMLPLSRPGPSSSSCLGLQLPQAVLPATLVSIRRAFRGRGVMASIS